ncbi:MAG: hypothetical protein WC607_00590 [Candidatus Micrarchaeia archaeon]
MKKKCVCQACRYSFISEAAVFECPRCHGQSLTTRVATHEDEIAAQASALTRKENLTGGKESWREFHSSGSNAVCPKCNGTQFKLDYKHKERICLSCGELLPLPRRSQ